MKKISTNNKNNVEETREKGNMNEKMISRNPTAPLFFVLKLCIFPFHQFPPFTIIAKIFSSIVI